MLLTPQAAQIMMKSQEREFSAFLERERLLAEARQANNHQGESFFKRAFGGFRKNRK